MWMENRCSLCDRIMRIQYTANQFIWLLWLDQNGFLYYSNKQVKCSITNMVNLQCISQFCGRSMSLSDPHSLKVFWKDKLLLWPERESQGTAQIKGRHVNPVAGAMSLSDPHRLPWVFEKCVLMKPHHPCVRPTCGFELAIRSLPFPKIAWICQSPRGVINTRTPECLAMSELVWIE